MKPLFSAKKLRIMINHSTHTVSPNELVSNQHEKIRII